MKIKLTKNKFVGTDEKPYIIAEIGSNHNGSMALVRKLIESAKIDAKKIISQSRQKLNEDIRAKKEKIKKEIDQETSNAEKEIQKFKLNSIEKINSISEDIVSDMVKDIFGEDLNKSSIKATVSQVVKENLSKKI